MTYEPTVDSSLSATELGQATARAGNGLASKAAEILDDVRRALDRDVDGARAAALRLVSLLASSAPKQPAKGGLAPWQKRKIDLYLREHLDNPIRVEDLADQVSLSVSHFCRAFKESFAETPHAHVMRLRLELAQRLMLTTEAPLSRIARDCGLSDQAHLSKLFRRCLGETPSSWRRLNLNDAGRGCQGDT
jgi:AraC-like DNA-binding protein